MAKTQDDDIDGEDALELEPDPDLLAAVVLHVLVTEGREGASAETVAQACERDPGEEAELSEVETALEILIRDDLARRLDDELGAHPPLFAPTRAAIRAAELSF